MGTVDYMSPEQAMDTRSVDGRADIYALGCTLHYLLTGKPPFSGENMMQRLMAHKVSPIPSLQRRRPDVPDRLDQLFHSMLAKDVDDRIATMAEVIAELEECRLEVRSDSQRSASGRKSTPKKSPIRDRHRKLDRRCLWHAMKRWISKSDLSPRMAE